MHGCRDIPAWMLSVINGQNCRYLASEACVLQVLLFLKKSVSSSEPLFCHPRSIVANYATKPTTLKDSHLRTASAYISVLSIGEKYYIMISLVSPGYTPTAQIDKFSHVLEDLLTLCICWRFDRSLLQGAKLSDW